MWCVRVYTCAVCVGIHVVCECVYMWCVRVCVHVSVLACVYLCRSQNQGIPLWLSAFIVLKQGLLLNLEFTIFR